MTTLEFVVVPMVAAVLVGLVRGESLRSRAAWRTSGSATARPNHLGDAVRDPESGPSSWGWASCSGSARS